MVRLDEASVVEGQLGRPALGEFLGGLDALVHAGVDVGDGAGLDSTAVGPGFEALAAAEEGEGSLVPPEHPASSGPQAKDAMDAASARRRSTMTLSDSDRRV